MRVFVLISVTNSMYRILEYPKIMSKQYRFVHFPSSYTRRSSKNPQSICPCLLYTSYMMASANKFLRIYYATVKDYLDSLEA